MTPNLPRYTKVPHDEHAEESNQLLLGERAAATSTSTGAGTGTASGPIKLYEVPPGLIKYELNGRFMLWTGKTAISTREQTRLVRLALPL